MDEETAPDAFLTANRIAVQQEFAEMKARWEAYAAPYRARAKIQERFYNGDQLGGLHIQNGAVQVTDDTFTAAKLERQYGDDVYSPGIDRVASLVSDGRPGVAAVAASEEPNDTFNADFAQRVIEFLQREINTDELFHKSVVKALLGGTAIIKCFFDTSADAVTAALSSIHETLLEPGKEWKDSRAVMFSGHIDEDEANDILRDLGHDKEVKAKPYDRPSGEKLHGVETWEVYRRPSTKFPEGYFGFWIEGTLVELIPYPLVIQNDSGKPEYPLPIAVVHARNAVDPCPYGLTPATAAISHQRYANELLTRQAELLALIAASIHYAVPRVAAPEGQAAFDPLRPGVFDFPVDENTVKAIAQMGWTEPPQIPETLDAEAEKALARCERALGLSDPTLGDRTGAPSGVAIEHAVNLDRSAQNDLNKSLEEAIVVTIRLLVAYVREQYQEERQAKITNAMGADVFAFAGADLQGVDVVLEPSSELDSLSSTKKAKAVEAGEDPSMATNNPVMGFSRQVAEDLVATFLQTRQLPPIEPGDLDLSVADEVVSKHLSRALTGRDRATYAALKQLRSHLASLRARTEEAAPLPEPQEIPS